ETLGGGGVLAVLPTRVGRAQGAREVVIQLVQGAIGQHGTAHAVLRGPPAGRVRVPVVTLSCLQYTRSALEASVGMEVPAPYRDAHGVLQTRTTVTDSALHDPTGAWPEGSACRQSGMTPPPRPEAVRPAAAWRRIIRVQDQAYHC